MIKTLTGVFMFDVFLKYLTNPYLAFTQGVKSLINPYPTLTQGVVSFFGIRKMIHQEMIHFWHPTNQPNHKFLVVRDIRKMIKVGIPVTSQINNF